MDRGDAAGLEPVGVAPGFDLGESAGEGVVDRLVVEDAQPLALEHDPRTSGLLGEHHHVVAAEARLAVRPDVVAVAQVDEQAQQEGLVDALGIRAARVVVGERAGDDGPGRAAGPARGLRAGE